MSILCKPTYVVGDRFYFYKNMTDSDTIKVGFKGVIDEVLIRTHGVIYCHDGYGFASDEIKPIIRRYGVLA